MMLASELSKLCRGQYRTDLPEQKALRDAFVEGNFKEATARTKATNREAADDLSPTEKVVVVYDLVDLGRHKMELSFVG